MTTIRLLLLMLLPCMACRTSPPTMAEQRAQQVERHTIVIQFHGMEGLKRVPYRYPNLRLEMLREVAREPLTVTFTMECTRQELEGHLFKLGQDADVISAESYE